MKSGNEFYLAVVLTDKCKKRVDIRALEKIVFIFNESEFIYPSENVKYDKSLNIFKIYLTEENTLSFKSFLKVESIIIFKNNLVSRSVVDGIIMNDTLKKEVIK